MAIALQKTKLFLPPAREKLVERPRLLKRLDSLRAGGSRAALISAPAGSGKTTLVVQWLSGAGWPVGWVSLDARDNLPARFFAYLVESLQAAVPGAGREALALLDLPGASMEEVITLLTNDLAEAKDPLVLALDDFHSITNPQLQQAVDLLIEAQPPQMRIILLSREDPDLQLARRRARGQLVELRQNDLRFTLEESLAFLNHSMGLNLSTGQVERLEARTEGWIAGLQMAALALQEPLSAQRTPDVERFLNDFSGSHRFILDYLVEEVLARQTEDVQRFLLETSVLESMCAELCAAVTGSTATQAQALLDQMSRANLFVISLDEERRWVRYHHLFRDLLLARLQSEYSLRTAALERRASSWYAANGEPRLAVEFALKAGDAGYAADIIESHLRERWQTVDLEFHLLINRLPFEAIAERPSLCLQSAWLCVMFGQPSRLLSFVEAAERCLDAPERVPQPDDAANHAFAHTLRAWLADLHNQPVVLDKSLELALAAIPEDNVGMRNSVAVVIGTIYYMEGDFETAIRLNQAALELDQRVNGTNAVPITTMRIVLALQALGRLREAERRIIRAETYIRERGSRRFYISGVINLLWGEILLEWNRLDEAEAQMHQGLRLLENWPLPQVRALGLALIARLLAARGDLVDAQAQMESADALQRQTSFHPIFQDALERARVCVAIARQDKSALEAWAGENAFTADKEMRFRYEGRQIAICRVWLALGREEDAAGLLERLAGAAQGRGGSRLIILALLAAARRAHPEPALEVLDEALRLGEPEGWLRTFMEIGSPLRAVLELWLQSGHAQAGSKLRDYALRILAAFDGIGAVVHTQVDLPEALSPREQEVLLLVARGLTNQQIAARLVISIRTVKKHVENIHGKLGVQNRTQAVARARELGLLD